METNIQRKVNELNKRYHRIIRDRFIDKDLDIEQFKTLVKQIKIWGYAFRLTVPNTDFANLALTEFESNLFSRLELVRAENKYGIDNGLYRYAYLMHDCEKGLCRELYTSLCKREALDSQYFQTDGVGYRIDFIQSGHWIDAYILL